MEFGAEMRARFGENYKERELLARHVNFRIGGPARHFVEAKTSQDIIDAVALAQKGGVPWFVLGGGSNTLVADAGFDGLVVKAANRTLTINGTHVTAEAGVISAMIARQTAQKGLRGFEWAISLPGSIGGAVRGNAGCFGGEMKDVVESVRVLHDGVVETLRPNQLHFTYRHSIFKDPARMHDVVLDVTLSLQEGDSVEALAILDKNLAGRKASQPLGSSSAGCVFKNFAYRDVSDIANLDAKYTVPPEMKTRKQISAGWIIDNVGLKGTAVGDAAISDTHGNFLVNKGAATAEQIVQLIALVKSRVRDAVGVQLQEEVQLVGF